MVDRKQVLPVVVELAELADLAVRHLAVVARAASRAKRCGWIRGRRRPARACRRSTCRRLAGELLERHGGDFDVDVDAVEQRPADLAHVALDLRHACSGSRGAGRCDSRTGRG